MASANKQLEGVGGWLSVLIFVLALITPLKALGESFTGLADLEASHPEVAGQAAWHYAKHIIQGFGTAQAVCSFMLGWLLLKRRDRFIPGSVIIGLWIIGPVRLMLMYSAVSDTYPVPEPTAYVQIAISAAWAAIWSLYLWRSLRVRNTYIA